MCKLLYYPVLNVFMMSENPGLVPHITYRLLDGGTESFTDQLAVEEPLDIRIVSGGTARSVAITMRTPGRDEDLARGFLFTEGVFTARPQDAVEVVKSNVVNVVVPAGTTIDWKRLERHAYTTSSCGVCGKTSLEQVYAAISFGSSPATFTVAGSIILSLPDRLRAAQLLFALTGGIHAAGLFDLNGNLLGFAEDVGRHNALDKLVGGCLRQELLPLDCHLLLLSGRASFELIQKAAMAGIALVAAVGAPSSLAVSLAEELGITLCGFVRKNAFNVYSNVFRLSDK